MNDRQQFDDEVVDLYTQHHGAMRGSLLRRGIPHPVVDEIVNDVFVAVRRRWPHIRDNFSIGYAYKIAANECAKWWSQNTKEEKFRDRNEGDFADERDEYLQILNRVMINQAMKDLTPREQEVIHLRFYKQLSVEEAAEFLQLSTGSVKSYTHTAKIKLRAKLNELDNEIGEEEQ
ncbi:sigma-70 family RNA polymerase sigma factor [Streptomyces anulatus]|uniref:RNA polymerase sigma factor n=1 Tax=Streptomyces anulatus TaxID=1892 RepID=UPI002F90E2B5|nr:sigma-70 family RNA polymerase sigma factor [Streptomyces anulatus]